MEEELTLKEIQKTMLDLGLEEKIVAFCPECNLPFFISAIKKYKCKECGYKMQFDEIIWCDRDLFPKA